MKLSNTLLVVKDIDLSIQFYHEVFGLDVILDFGANKTLTGGLCLQTEDSWTQLIDSKDVSFGGNNMEIYFEEDDFDAFVQKIRQFEIDYVHPVKEHTWGQRVVRIYDPDRHIVEVGENMTVVCKRFYDSGMTPEQVAKRMDVPVDYVVNCLNLISHK